ncbi:hypothetical protein PSV09DRAFT_2383060 [Bipolaris maydis]|nr:hypothetical protein J3E74DRAFT_477718 [Bipolaris maydis]KAJ6208486.1 hypothetical protein PSV09DRAFT_2383060 [Bipolaris maydis]
MTRDFFFAAVLICYRFETTARPKPPLSNAVLDEDYYNGDNNNNASASSVNTICADLTADSGHARLKQKLLDCLAEFAANRKGGATVACSAMRESGDSVSIWIARNEGFSEANKPMFSVLERLLESYLCGKDTNTDVRLWKELVSFRQSRIQSRYILDLRASLKAFEAGYRKTFLDTTGDSSDIASKFSILRNLLFDKSIHEGSTFDRHSELVIAAYNLRRSSILEQMLNNPPQASSKSRRLWVNICLTAQLRVTFEKFKETALTFPSFMYITITLVFRPPALASAPRRLMKLRETFDILGLETKKKTIQAVMGQKWTLIELERKFAKGQIQKLKIHAEVRLLMHLNTSNTSGPGPLPYIGCITWTPKTRGSHGRLFKSWTIPNMELLPPGQVERISEALISLQNEIVEKLVTPVAGKVRLERTSVFGGSSLVGTRHDEISTRRAQIDHLVIKRGQTETLVNCYHFTPIEEEYNIGCDVCDWRTKRRCSYCNKGYFCSELCEVKASVYHLFTCSKRQLTSANYLWKSLVEDTIPVDENVLQDFGFNNAFDASDRSNLVGLYRGIYLSGDIASSDLHGWRIKGVMVEKIKEMYYRIPESHRGQYFPWWLKNLHRLQKPTTKEETERSIAQSFFDKEKLYLDPQAHNMHPEELKPEAKRDSFLLLSHMLHRLTPNPSTTLYHTFTFVACRNKTKESQLTDIYILLLVPSYGSFFYTCHNERRSFTHTHTASSAAFWKPYEAGTLLQLIGSSRPQAFAHLLASS